MHLNSKETRFSPIGTPRIPSNPILNFTIRINTPPNNSNFMINEREQAFFWINTSCILFKLISNWYTTRNRSSLINFSLHLISARNRAILGYFPAFIISNRPTFAWIYSSIGWNWTSTVHAFLNCGTVCTFGVFS